MKKRTGKVIGASVIVAGLLIAGANARETDPRANPEAAASPGDPGLSDLDKRMTAATLVDMGQLALGCQIIEVAGEVLTADDLALLSSPGLTKVEDSRVRWGSVRDISAGRGVVRMAVGAGPGVPSVVEIELCPYGEKGYQADLPNNLSDPRLLTLPA